jgi:predicted GH43/DUF377 family glycosyl hydrolase
MNPNDLSIRRLPVRFSGDDRRVILRPFVMSHGRVRTLFERLHDVPPAEVESLLATVTASFTERHGRLVEAFDEHFKIGVELTGWTRTWDPVRKRLAGAYLTMEYAIDSAALFNPSIVTHPDQSGLAVGTVRFLMSLRATGEGHVSSIVFRTGTVNADLEVTTDPLPSRLSRSRASPDAAYERGLFARKLDEIGIDAQIFQEVSRLLPDSFTLRQLSLAVEAVRPTVASLRHAGESLQTILFLAQSNYHIDLTPAASLAELVIFPMSADESKGIEDLRMVRFIEDDGSVKYFGTYTAYNGFRTLPMLMMCDNDFRRFEMHSLNGPAAMDKGMALFPRRIRGKYVMCSRIDGENLFIGYSDSVHFWNNAHRLIAPKYPWELMQIGNCGSPIETPHGWLLLTHGVGPMRCYAIGAMLLDLDDPRRVIGHLREPLMVPLGEERDGYVPNVVYTCGAMIHGDYLMVPYAQADKSTGLAAILLQQLLNRLRGQ